MKGSSASTDRDRIYIVDMAPMTIAGPHARGGGLSWCEPRRGGIARPFDHRRPSAGTMMVFWIRF